MNSNEQHTRSNTHAHTHKIRIYYLDEWHLKSTEKHPMCAIKMKSRTGPDRAVLYRQTEETHTQTLYQSEEIDTNCAMCVP